ncbi:MAG: hypothetical protein CK552_03875 [Actinobacteria bacterium]|nr:MAG: hypothetical protein CK552_03875 [Actinomycetota bacterium]
MGQLVPMGERVGHPTAPHCGVRKPVVTIQLSMAVGIASLGRLVYRQSPDRPQATCFLLAATKETCMHAHLKTLNIVVVAALLISGLGISPSGATPISNDSTSSAFPNPSQLSQPLMATAIEVPTMARVLAQGAATSAVNPARVSALAPALSPHQRLVTQVAVLRKRIAILGRKQVGDTYRSGASGPNAFDCSGLTRYVFKQVTGRDLPHSSGAQYKMAHKISLKNAQPGDLVFYLRGGAHHVGLYLGNGKMVHATGHGSSVKIHSIFGPWYYRHFSGLGRVLPA